jgi:hypothetical protein
MTGEEEIKSSEIEHVVNIRNKLVDVTQLVQRFENEAVKNQIEI